MSPDPFGGGAKACAKTFPTPSNGDYRKSISNKSNLILQHLFLINLIPTCALNLLTYEIVTFANPHLIDEFVLGSYGPEFGSFNIKISPHSILFTVEKYTNSLESIFTRVYASAIACE
jgi:hypothetical protein